MARSVKRKDGSYIDTEGIYDVTQGKTQKEVNASNLLSAHIKTVTATLPSSIVSGTMVDFTIPKGALVLSIQCRRIDPANYVSELLNSNMANYCNYVNDTTFRMGFTSSQGQYANKVATLYYLEV